jgi:hypothetical protein
VWKLADAPGDLNETWTSVGQFLRQLDFEDVRTEGGLMGGTWVVHAHKGECRLSVVELVSSKGWPRDLIKTYADPSEELFIVSRGVVYDYRSTWLDIIGELYFKTLRRIGFTRATSGFAVVAAPKCAARQLPWNELRPHLVGDRGTSR